MTTTTDTYETLDAACERARADYLAADAAHMAAIRAATARGMSDPHEDPEVMRLAAAAGDAALAESRATMAVRRFMGTEVG